MNSFGACIFDLAAFATPAAGRRWRIERGRAACCSVFQPVPVPLCLRSSVVGAAGAWRGCPTSGILSAVAETARWV